MSRIFAQVADQLNITHCFSSAYHPESQGTLERFHHQTLKSMLRAYCLEFDKEWDEVYIFCCLQLGKLCKSLLVSAQQT